jgi:hypothetical protein
MYETKTNKVKKSGIRQPNLEVHMNFSPASVLQTSAKIFQLVWQKSCLLFKTKTVSKKYLNQNIQIKYIFEICYAKINFPK